MTTYSGTIKEKIPRFLGVHNQIIKSFLTGSALYKNFCLWEDILGIWVFLQTLSTGNFTKSHENFSHAVPWKKKKKKLSYSCLADDIRSLKKNTWGLNGNGRVRWWKPRRYKMVVWILVDCDQDLQLARHTLNEAKE
jgi:hypothetical protein